MFSCFKKGTLADPKYLVRLGRTIGFLGKDDIGVKKNLPTVCFPT